MKPFFKTPVWNGQRRRLGRIVFLTLMGVGLPCFSQEVELAAEDKKQMDPFEAHSLGKADKSFNEKQYKSAAVEYDSFLLEFPQSRVRAYALFRKARSVDLDNKRFEAIKQYKEVLDYFPNAIHYAAAALYYMGACYLGTGNPEKAIKAWLEMTQDTDYRQHFLAAAALNNLAENARKEDKLEKAMLFYEQVVVDFRTANPESAGQAMENVLEYLMKTHPNEPKLRAFYVKAGGFERQPQQIKGDPATQVPYWAFIRRRVRHYGTQFDSAQPSNRLRFFQYWAAVMEGKFPEDDSFQIDWIDFRYAFENDQDKRAKRLDAQFAKYQKPDDYPRIIGWLTLYLGNKAKLNEYYAKLDLAKLGKGGIESLMFVLLDQKEYAMALNAFEKLPLDDRDDAARENFARSLWPHVRSGFSVTALERISNSFTDKDYGAMMLLRYYYSVGNAAAGLPLAEKLKSHPKFATETLNIMGDFYAGTQQYEKAIACYQQANNPPDTTFKIADCYFKLDKLDAAVAALREVENFFIKDAPRAAMTIAGFYQKAGVKDKEIAALRAVMKKYPQSPESSTAHQELEKLGIRIGGGVDSEK